MRSFDTGNQALAVLLAGLSGFIDATGFIATGGFFLAFMTGNSTRLGVGLIEDAAHWKIAASLIAAFLVGVMAGTLVGRAAGRWHRPAVLMTVGMLLLGAAGLAMTAAGVAPDAVVPDALPGVTIPVLLLTAAAMGAVNMVFEADGEVKVGLTYMTGNLVKLGQRLAGLSFGRGRWDWVPFLVLWSAMLAGAVLGAAVWPVLGLGSLWTAAAVTLGLAMLSWRLEFRSI